MSISIEYNDPSTVMPSDEIFGVSNGSDDLLTESKSTHTIPEKQRLRVADEVVVPPFKILPESKGSDDLLTEPESTHTIIEKQGIGRSVDLDYDTLIAESKSTHTKRKRLKKRIKNNVDFNYHASIMEPRSTHSMTRRSQKRMKFADGNDTSIAANSGYPSFIAEESKGNEKTDSFIDVSELELDVNTPPFEMPPESDGSDDLLTESESTHTIRSRKRMKFADGTDTSTGEYSGYPSPVANESNDNETDSFVDDSELELDQSEYEIPQNKLKKPISKKSHNMDENIKNLENAIYHSQLSFFRSPKKGRNTNHHKKGKGPQLKNIIASIYSLSFLKQFPSGFNHSAMPKGNNDPVVIKGTGSRNKFLSDISCPETTSLLNQKTDNSDNVVSIPKKKTPQKINTDSVNISLKPPKKMPSRNKSENHSQIFDEEKTKLIENNLSNNKTAKLIRESSPVTKAENAQKESENSAEESIKNDLEYTSVDEVISSVIKKSVEIYEADLSNKSQTPYVKKPKKKKLSKKRKLFTKVDIPSSKTINGIPISDLMKPRRKVGPVIQVQVKSNENSAKNNVLIANSKYSIVNSFPTVITTNHPSLTKKRKQLEKNLIDCQTENSIDKWRCMFCQRKPYEDNMGCLYGPYYMEEDGSTDFWFHDECFIWGNFPVSTPFKPFNKYSLDSIKEALKSHCFLCGKKGAAITCSINQCHQYHYPCARKINYLFCEENSKAYCPEHAATLLNIKPPKDDKFET